MKKVVEGMREKASNRIIKDNAGQAYRLALADLLSTLNNEK